MKKEFSLEELEVTVEEKRLELKEKLKRNVYSYVIKISDEDYAVAYVKEPERLVKMRVLDMLATQQGMSAAGDMLLSTSLIPEESDKRILSTSSEYDTLYLTMVTNCIELIQVYADVIKKK